MRQGGRRVRQRLFAAHKVGGIVRVLEYGVRKDHARRHDAVQPRDQGRAAHRHTL